MCLSQRTRKALRMPARSGDSMTIRWPEELTIHPAAVSEPLLDSTWIVAARGPWIGSKPVFYHSLADNKAYR
jgi:hypothetical protein